MRSRNQTVYVVHTGLGSFIKQSVQSNLFHACILWPTLLLVLTRAILLEWNPTFTLAEGTPSRRKARMDTKQAGLAPKPPSRQTLVEEPFPGQ